MGQGWFESDDDYQQRMSREANEATVERLSGSAPRQGFFESDEDYASRITDEANSAVIEHYSGDSPRQGWLESDSDYRHRIAEEAHESTIESLSGSAPRQGWLEDSDDYRHRIRHEANAALLEGLGEAARQGWFESDSDFRSRVSLAARELRAEQGWSSDERSLGEGSGGGSYSSPYSGTAGSGGYSSGSSSSDGSSGIWLLVLGLLAIPIVLASIGSQPPPQRATDVMYASPRAIPPAPQTGAAPAYSDSVPEAPREDRYRPFCEGDNAVTADWAIPVLCGDPEALRLQRRLVELLDERVAVRGENWRSATFSFLAADSSMLRMCQAFHSSDPQGCLMRRLREYVRGAEDRLEGSRRERDRLEGRAPERRREAFEEERVPEVVEAQPTRRDETPPPSQEPADDGADIVDKPSKW